MLADCLKLLIICNVHYSRCSFVFCARILEQSTFRNDCFHYHVSNMCVWYTDMTKVSHWWTVEHSSCVWMSVRVEEFLNANVCIMVVAMKGVCVLMPI